MGRTVGNLHTCRLIFLNWKGEKNKIIADLSNSSVRTLEIKLSNSSEITITSKFSCSCCWLSLKKRSLARNYDYWDTESIIRHVFLAKRYFVKKLSTKRISDDCKSSFKQQSKFKISKWGFSKEENLASI